MNPALRSYLFPTMVGGVLSLSAGCFSERSFPMRDGDFVRLRTDAAAAGPATTRAWLRDAHSQLKHLLPRNTPSALLTEDLVDSGGRPVDVLRHFNFKRESLETLGGNCEGLMNTAQLNGSDFSRVRPAPQWPGYEDVWITINPKLSLHGLLGYSRVGDTPRDADCIVLLPGIMGHNDISRTHDLANALRQAGFHALALELRGHGQTEVKYPDVFYNFGILETADLMVVAEWLKKQPNVRRIGLVGFCWGANHSLISAWYDGRSEDDPNISERQRRYLRPIASRQHFEAGVIAFSPVLRFEEIFEEVARPRNYFVHPVLVSLQDTVHSRVLLKGHQHQPCFDPQACPGDLRKLIDYEYARSELNYPGSVDEGLRFLRFLPYKGLPDGDKLECARIPVLIVQAANDPLSGAQDIAVLMAQTTNPNVAAVVLPGGGHVGFAAYARAYYFSLILNFFTRQTSSLSDDLH